MLNLTTITSNRLKRICHLLLAFLGCLQLCGGPMGLMQCVAWTGMLVSYTQENGVAEGLRKTFDGEHPCRICLAIETVNEQAPESPGPERTPHGDGLKICKDMIPLRSDDLPALVFLDQAVTAVTEPAHLHAWMAHAPPVPPPRA